MSINGFINTKWIEMMCVGAWNHRFPYEFEGLEALDLSAPSSPCQAQA